MTWRDRAAPIIARVLADTRGKSEPEIKAALRAAYPFGPREYHPYKIWLSEIKRQRFGKPLPSPAESRKRMTEDDESAAVLFE